MRELDREVSAFVGPEFHSYSFFAVRFIKLLLIALVQH